MSLASFRAAAWLAAALLLPLALPAGAAEKGDRPADKSWVYVGTYTGKESKGIYRCEFDPAAGKLSEPTLVAETVNPTFLTIHPGGKFLYAVGEIGNFGGKKAGAVNAYSLDPKTGDLKLLNQQSSGGEGPCHVSLDKAGKHVLVANYGGGSVAVLPIKDDGSLGEATAFVQHKGSSVDKGRQEGPHAHSINLDKANHYAVAADLGLDKLLVYKFDAAKGTLTPNDPPAMDTPPGAGPRHFAFHPDGKHAYFCGEMDSTVTAMDYDAQKGVLTKVQTLSTLPAPHKGNSTAEVLVHPSGKFVYVSNRGHNSIAIFTVDEKTRQLTAAGHEGKGIKVPRNFNVDPSGKWMVVAGQDSNNLAVFEIDQKTGALKPTDNTVTVGNPVCVKFLTKLPPKPGAGGGGEEEDVKPAAAAPQWIWLGPAKENQTIYFRKEIEVKGPVSAVKLQATCDNALTLFLDGKQVAENGDWQEPVAKDLTDLFKRGGEGKHVIAVKGHNDSGPAGLLVRLTFVAQGREPFVVVTDESWLAAEKVNKGWQTADYDAKGWKPATVVAALGGGPWTQITEAALAGVAPGRKAPLATPGESLKVAKDFKAELLYSVPKEAQGSWVNMTADPKGRLIVSDQYGPLYRITPPPIGGKAEDTKVEQLNLPLGGAHGLLWAFDSLYVMVNEDVKFKGDKGEEHHPRRGLWRVRSGDGGDTFEKPEFLHEVNGSGEHGSHAILPGPDGKSLYIVCGNMTQMMKPLDASRVPKLWGEDHLLPRMPDGNGFMRGVLGPGGCIYKTDPDGKRWELFATGFRNEFDAAFNRQGELFTYDADMEWDMNTPWYRPTRVCLVTSGAEFGWRNGAGKWPPYYPDSLPAIYNVGPGSPTGMCFGYGAKFPAKYQDALYMCDWSYGKLYALHLTPEGSAYRGELEEFASGTPLQLTDVVVNPKDGALYFTIGGRKTQSGLYRVTYVGKDSTEPSKAAGAGAEVRALRHKLEAFHGHEDPKAVETAWPYLGHEDRFVRFAARVAIEHQDPRTWQDRALSEKEPARALAALLALVRATGQDPFHHPRKEGQPVPGRELQGPVLDALARIDFDRLPTEQRPDLLRVYAILFNRTGKPDEAARQKLIARFDPLFPSKSRELNAELCQLLVYLEAPSIAAKGLKIMAEAPTQEEQMEYARALRVLKTGWTMPQRKEYFTWFLKAANFKGGASIGGFMKIMKDDALATLTATEKEELKPILEARPIPSGPTVGKPRPFVREWKLDELVPLVEKGLKKKRDFDNGRTLFGHANCFACHRFDNEGGAQGPDLTGISGRFNVRDLLESILDPSKEISDQYVAVTITTTDGKSVTGRIVNQNNDEIYVMTNMLDPNGQTKVNAKKVESMQKSKVSMMPKGLLDTFQEDEVLDLVAYLMSRGDRNNKMFK
ncbi:MAG TPA: beta-propeller fold lactonase family protein [Gemmataceae bacterium]|nr:beta-propeller fold lactonase family protein [Gemmataceae bacterium]